MKIAVIGTEQGVGRKLVHENLIEVLEGSKSFECVEFDNNETSINEAEYCVIVTNTTKDSLDALKDLISRVEAKEKAYGVVINKVKESPSDIKTYCIENQIKVLEEISFDHKISDLADKGKLISIEDENYRMKFLTILNNAYVHMANMIFKLKTDGSGCGGH